MLWMTGNLGDVMHTSVLLAGLRRIRSARIDLAGFPSEPHHNWNSTLQMADRFIPEQFSDTIRQREEREQLLDRYDLIISVPGPFISDADKRKNAALTDLKIAKALGIPFVFAGHSIGPLQEQDFEPLSKADLIIAREPVTHQYLAEYQVPSHLGADYAFLYPYEQLERTGPFQHTFGKAYRLLFLRHDNLDFSRLTRKTDGSVWHGEETLFVQPDEGLLVLASSDTLRDQEGITALSRRLETPQVVCRDLSTLFFLIQGSRKVISDRYHPCVCGLLLEKEVQMMPGKNRFKMDGLKRLQESESLATIKHLAQTGLDRILRLIAAGKP